MLIDLLWTQSGDCPWPVGVLIAFSLPVAGILDWRLVTRPGVSLFTRRFVKIGIVCLGVYLALGLLPLQRNPAAEPVVWIDKSQHLLRFRDKVFKVALSNRSEGTKCAAGDSRTPEGRYRICSKAPDGPFGYWLGLDYPNRSDAWSARRAGRLSWLELTRWNWWWRSEPPQSTRLGGQIGLHGGGNRPNWTMGCIALDNSDIKLLYDQLSVGSVVEIR